MPHTYHGDEPRRSKRIKVYQKEQRNKLSKVYKKQTPKKGSKQKTQLLRNLILGQINQTQDIWDPPTTSLVKIRRNQYSTMGNHREKVQLLGHDYGCHTCGSFVHLDKNQPWIGDHIPSTNLKKSVKQILGCPEVTYLFPSCHSCSNEQAHLVKLLNGNPTMKLSKKQTKLIYGTWSTKFGVKATGSLVTPNQGKEIQRLGETYGCHICDTRMPASKYDSDHCFPQEFCTSYMEQIFLALQIPYPTTFELRPQCPRCSREQGGNMSNVSKRAVALAKKSGLVTNDK